ncbi:hypothetical protein EDD85DRAFT_114760 [Armillaria nabsnona]|nr:hypothetical protein EDD85DRAFT_114760 [Armillaria nabsnona]
MIPPDHWHADYEPPLLFPKNGMKICSISDEDHRAVSFNKAFYDYLYPAIADAFCEGFTHVEDSLFHPDPAADKFPAPQDPRLLSLLMLAGSPSIRKTAINRSMEELFTHALRNIATYMGLPGNLLNHETPPFELDSNRCAVLKLLYTLVSSDDFGATLLVDHQHITLMLFLRVLNATTPRHRFLPSNWCTPTMASKFTQIAFVPPDWTLSSSTRTLQFVYDFLQLGGPIANLVFSRFVSGWLLDHVVKLRGNKISDSRWRLQEILGAFISRMTSDLEIFDHTSLSSTIYLLFVRCISFGGTSPASASLHSVAQITRCGPSACRSSIRFRSTLNCGHIIGRKLSLLFRTLGCFLKKASLRSSVPGRP